MEITHSHVLVQGVISSPSSSYIVEKLLGKGGFGVVTQCRKMPTNETVALKVIGNIKYIDEAKEEEEMLRKLKRHNSDKFNIIRWNDAFLYQGWYCFEFEKLDMNLLEFMKKSTSKFLALMEIRPILQQLATTLQFLESLRIAHADLKPENIMVEDHQRQPPKIKVIDFGLASEVSKIPRGAVVQTLWYRAPEILLGAPFNETIDVWSLGCTAAEMFMGQTLFRGANDYDMMRHILNTVGRPPDHLLNSGMYTVLFFNPTRVGRGPILWASKTPLEDHYYTCTMGTINCLNDLLLKRCNQLFGKDARADQHDQACFVDLLRKMLRVDTAERITATQILQHPFITMSHLNGKFSNSHHVKSCMDLMNLNSDHGDKVSQSRDMKMCLNGEISHNSLTKCVLHEGQSVGLNQSEKVQGTNGESSQAKKKKLNRDKCARRTPEKPTKKGIGGSNGTVTEQPLHKRLKDNTGISSVKPKRKTRNDAQNSASCKSIQRRRGKKHEDHTYCKILRHTNAF